MLRSEIEYACDFISQAHFLVRTNNASRILHYGPNPPIGALHIPSLLKPYLIIRKNSGIHLDREKFENGIGKTGDGLLPNEKYGKNKIGYDAIGLIFFMLSRIEERESPILDHYQRFPFFSAFAVKHGWYNNPLADRAAFDVAKALRCDDHPKNKTVFNIRLTHDVDRLHSYHHVLGPLRTAAGHLLKRQAPKLAIKCLNESYFNGEPFRSFSRIMDHSEKKGLTSQFNFMGPTSVSQDSPYALRYKPLLSKIIQYVLKRNHKVGFHPGYYTVDNLNEWKLQKEGLEEIVGDKVKMGRQHVLRFKIDITPTIWDHFGMIHDATLAFPEASGYRPGTCRTFQAYSLKDRRVLNLKMGASAINEFGLFGGKYNNFTIDEALGECIDTINNCRRYGGELVILIHPGWPKDSIVWAFYDQLLNGIT